MNAIIPATEFAQTRAGDPTAEQLLAQAFTASGTATCVCQPDGIYLVVNPAYCELFGYAESELVGFSSNLVIPAESLGTSAQYAEQVSAGPVGTLSYGEFVLQRKGGTRLTVLVVTRTLMHGQTPCVVATLTDLSSKRAHAAMLKRRVAERTAALEEVVQHLRESDARFRALSENALDVVAIYDSHGRFTYISESSLRVLGYAPHELIGRGGDEFIHPDDLPEMRLRMQKLRTGELLLAAPEEYRFRHRNGQWRYLEGVATACFDVPAVNGLVINARDMTERHEYQARLKHQADHDALTGLVNRRALEGVLANAVQRRSQAPFGLMFIDLDRFKNINDSLGHAVGDEVLVVLAARVRQLLPPDAVIARFGGDEFVALLLENVTLQRVESVAWRIVRALQEPVPVQGYDLHVTASIGIALYPEHGTDAPSLIKRADIAMYQAKELGRDRVIAYQANFDATSAKRLKLESQLRKALAKREWLLHYQPQFDLTTGALTGVEALVRWQHPELGLLAPGAFISLAEESGVIVELGLWALQEACDQAARWVAAGTPIAVAVNLSAREFQQEHLPKTIAALLRETGTPPHLLELEVTESTLMHPLGTGDDVVRAISGLGVSLAIDDFGTGYSSFNYLRRFPFSKIKIDQSFVRDLPGNASDVAITRAIISMAQHLNLQVVAEGVETQEQADFLHTCGAVRAQGYLLGRPMLPERLGDLSRLRLHNGRMPEDAYPISVPKD